MKILRVINSLHIGGAERSIVGNVPLHIKNGYKMDVLLLNGEETFFLKKLKSEGVKVFSLNKNKTLYNPLYILKIIKFLKDYDIVHAHLFPSLYWVSLANFFSKTKKILVYTEHNTHNRRREIPFFKFIDRFIYKQYKHIITITPETNKNLIAHLKRKDNISTIYNGVDIDQIQKDKSKLADSLLKKYKGKKILIQVAGFREQKDQDTLIKSLEVLPEEFHILFVGEGKREETCKNLVRSLGLEDRVDFLGVQNNVGALYKIADIVVMSSHWEGFGRTAIEGMAAGKPVVASDVKGLANLVKGAGLLFEKSNKNMLAEQILRLSEDKEFYEKCVKRSIERAEEYSIERMVNGYEVIYEKLYVKSNEKVF